uniref:Uncharacterized protein n=1 Tax=Triticum urartu TaxID=4572 RepID=A0A8R7R5N7_TRIUA
ILRRLGIYGLSLEAGPTGFHNSREQDLATVGDIEDQDGQHVAIEFAELARTDHELVTSAAEGTIYLQSPIDVMTLAASTATTI